MLRLPAVSLLVLATTASATFGDEPDGSKLKLHMRSQVKRPAESGEWIIVEKETTWDARATAIVICDMWDDHYCRASARRVAEMAPRMNQIISTARQRGVLIIHCPSGCLDKYEDTPQRRLARQAPPVNTTVPLAGWCFLDSRREPPLPITDSEPCDDAVPRERVRFYTRQHKAIEIADGDAITDNAEAFYLMKQRGISNVIVMGVHTNMCVLGRPFGIRQMTYQGQNVTLMRDMTDSMYNPRQTPHVSHFDGNDLVIAHVERYWCPTITSVDFLGGKPFRFAEDDRPTQAKRDIGE